MTTENQETQSITNSANFWTDQEIDMLGKALAAAYKTQTTYKEPLDLKDRVLGWRMVLEGELTMDQVLSGIIWHMKRSHDMPVPAHINNIVNPPPREITKPEYFHAKEQWALNGYGQFCDHLDVIKAYEKQSLENVRAHEEIECEKTKQIINNSIRRIT